MVPVEPVTFVDREPPITRGQGRRWNGVLAQLQDNPGRWAVLENESRRSVEYIREIWDGLPVSIKSIPTGERATRELWLRWNG